MEEVVAVEEVEGRGRQRRERGCLERRGVDQGMVAGVPAPTLES